MNELSPTDYLLNRSFHQKTGTVGMQALSKPFRDAFRRRYLAGGGNPTGLNALHRLDMVAGGNPSDIARMGDGAIDQDIGNQWKSKMDDLDEHAEKLQKENCPRMKVELKDCAEIA